MNSEFHIRDVAKVTNGKSDVKDAMENGAFVFFDRSGSSKRSNRYLFDEEAAIIIPGEDSREVFEPRFCSGKFDLHQRCYVVYAFKDEISPKYLFYKLKTLTKHFANVFVGSTVPSLRLDHITDLKISAPSVDEQEKIAAVLSALDAKIELNNRINRELEAMAKTIYDYWFVQFEFPDANGRPYKTSDGKMTYNTQLKRDIPADWEVHRLGSILHTSLGGTPSTEKDEYWKDGEYHWLNSGEVAEFPVITSELKITQKGIAKSATELLPSGTTLLSITRHLRPTILAIDACVNQSVVGIRETETIKHYFIYPFVKNEIPRLMTLRTGAQQPHINKDTVDDTLIAIPTSQTNLLCRYNRSVEGIYKQIFNIACQNRQLAALRDWLLPMLMNGQVTVK